MNETNVMNQLYWVIGYRFDSASKVADNGIKDDTFYSSIYEWRHFKIRYFLNLIHWDKCNYEWLKGQIRGHQIEIRNVYVTEPYSISKSDATNTRVQTKKARRIRFLVCTVFNWREMAK